MKLPKQIQSRKLSAAPPPISATSLYLAAAEQPSAPLPSSSPLVYALGTLGYSFVSGPRRDLFVQEMAPASPTTHSDLLVYLAENPSQAALLAWTISVDQTPIYVLQPEPAFGRETYALLRQFLGQLSGDHAMQVSVPGRVSGQITLMTGETTPVVQPALPGMYGWFGGALLQLFLTDGKLDAQEQQQISDQIDKFQQRVYAELRNHGRTAQERALNYAATQAYQLLWTQMADATARQTMQDLELSEITVKPSPICRPGAAPDCWDVELRFFDPDQHLVQPRRVYRFTVDVSTVIPVTIGEPGEWLRYD
ncbi:MAG: hypothetical protein U0350_10115 [Caldilineaceae bacterium]